MNYTGINVSEAGENVNTGAGYKLIISCTHLGILSTLEMTDSSILYGMCIHGVNIILLKIKFILSIADTSLHTRTHTHAH